MPKWDADETGFYYRANWNSLEHKNIVTGEVTVIMEPINCDAFYFDVSADGNFVSLNVDQGYDKNIFIYSVETAEMSQITESGIFWGFPYWCRK